MLANYGYKDGSGEYFIAMITETDLRLQISDFRN